MTNDTETTQGGKPSRRHRGKNRPRNEIIAEARAKLARLEGRAIAKEAASHPEVAELDSQIEELNSTMLKYVRHEKEADEKIQNFLQRAETWKRNKATAAAGLPNIRKQIQALRDQREAVIQNIAKGNMVAS